MINIYFVLKSISQNSLKEIVDVTQSILTSAAIIIGGIWSYMLFIKKRQKYPRADISHQITHAILSKSKILLRVKTILRNKGDVLLALSSGEVRLQQIFPLQPGFAHQIDQIDPVPENKSEVEWPLLGVRSFYWIKGECELEPGEQDCFIAEFICDAKIELVSVYSYFQNVKKYNRDIGWGITTLYKIDKTIKGEEMSRDKFIIAEQHPKQPRPGTKPQPAPPKRKDTPRPQQPQKPKPPKR